MVNEDKRSCRLTTEGLQKWSNHNIEADPRQVFTIEYQNKDHFWIKVWWGQSALIPLNMIKEVVWDETVGDYV